MANHLHRQIREAVESRLTGLASTGSRVYANRLAPLPDSTSASLLIVLDEERVDPLSIHSPELQDRRLTLTVSAVVKGGATIDDTLDQCSKEVETALAAGITVAGQTLYPQYTGMQFDDELADRATGVKRMTFTVSFTTSAAAPDVLI